MPAQTFDTVPHLAIVAHGSLPGAEQWSCTLRTTKVEATLDNAVLRTFTTAAVAAWRTVVTDASAAFSTHVALSGVTVRSLDSRGLTVDQADASPLTSGVGIGPVTLPNQCAIVASLLTARAGRTGKGRIYLPALGASYGSTGDGTLASNVTAIYATRMKELIDSLNTALGALPNTPKIGVQSKTASSQLGGSYTGAAITSVRVGSIVDTQRRRRASLTEVYSAQTIA